MKVKELIEELKKCNPDADVRISTYDDSGEIERVDCGNPASCAIDVCIETGL